jgi:hypothetical protein
VAHCQQLGLGVITGNVNVFVQLFDLTGRESVTGSNHLTQLVDGCCFTGVFIDLHVSSVNVFILQTIHIVGEAILEDKWVQLAVCFEHSIGLFVLETIVLDVGDSTLNDAKVGLVLDRSQDRL